MNSLLLVLPLIVVLGLVVLFVPCVSADCEFTTKHIHLAVGHDASTSMTVSFSTDVDCDVKGDEDLARENFLLKGAPVGLVLIGTSPNSLNRTVLETSPAMQYVAQYVNRHMSYVSPFFHHLLVQDLEPDTKYYYRVFSQVREPEEERDGYDRHRTLHRIGAFTTAPKSDQKDKNRPITFAVFGDVGLRDQTATSIGILERSIDHIDAAILVGDVAYTRLRHHMWDIFFDVWDRYNFMSTIPIQVAAGNHDIDRHPTSGEIFTAFDCRFRMPEVSPVQKAQDHLMGENFADRAVPYPLRYDYGNAYYAYTYGIVRNIVLSSYSSMEGGSDQLLWLEAELKSVDRAVTPWLTVTLHVPFYNTYEDHHDDKQAIVAKRALEPLFVSYRVNCVFSGHEHAYQRSHPVAYDTTMLNGVVYLTVGSFFRRKGRFRSATPEKWLACRDVQHHGYGRMTFFNRTHATWNWLGYRSGTMDLGRNDTVHILNQFYD